MKLLNYGLKKDYRLTIEDFRLLNLTHDECFRYLSNNRKATKCPKCNFNEFFGPSKRGLFECKNCGYQKSITSGSIMEKTRVPLDKWFLLFFMIKQENEKPSVVKVQKELQVSYPTAKLLLEKTKSDEINYWLRMTTRFIHQLVMNKRKEWIKNRFLVDFTISQDEKDGGRLWLRKSLNQKMINRPFL